MCIRDSEELYRVLYRLTFSSLRNMQVGTLHPCPKPVQDDLGSSLQKTKLDDRLVISQEELLSCRSHSFQKQFGYTMRHTPTNRRLEYQRCWTTFYGWTMLVESPWFAMSSHTQGYGSPLRFYIYELKDWTPAGNAERGQLCPGRRPSCADKYRRHEMFCAVLRL